MSTSLVTFYNDSLFDNCDSLPRDGVRRVLLLDVAEHGHPAPQPDTPPVPEERPGARLHPALVMTACNDSLYDSCDSLPRPPRD